jgi:hypothetical protein
MKRALSMTVLLVACARSRVIDFEFLGTGGRPVYQSTKLAETLHAESLVEVIAVLVETPSFDDERYRKQFKVLESLDGEELSLLYIAACPCGSDPSGYSTTAETARRLAGGVPRFRITLLDGQGGVLAESDAVLSPAAITQAAARARRISATSGKDATRAANGRNGSFLATAAHTGGYGAGLG